MLEHIFSDIYRIKVPLPRNPLKYTNSYVIVGKEKNLIVDTGLNRDECLDVLQQCFVKLGVDIERSDLFLTHIHSDHSGLAPRLHAQGACVYASEPVATVMNSNIDWEEIFKSALLNGLPAEDLEQTRDKHPGFKYSPKGTIDFAKICQDQDRIAVSEFEFLCLFTPGHSTGHMCLYEPRQKILMAGDHILAEITPNISQWSQNDNPLKQYLRSLDKISKLEVDLVLPGHRKIFNSCRQRIREIKEHHQKRLQEILSIMDQVESTAYNIASKMTWDMDYSSWSEFPLAQKWFATGEALAHLTYLEQKGLIEKNKHAEQYIFRKKDLQSSLT